MAAPSGSLFVTASSGYQDTGESKEFMLTRITNTLMSVALVGAITAAEAYAGEISHFVPG